MQTLLELLQSLKVKLQCGITIAPGSYEIIADYQSCLVVERLRP